MLAKLAPRFVISRIIQNAYYTEMMSIQLLKQPFGSHRDYFGIHDAQRFYECKFYGYISTLPAPKDFVNRFEADTYEEAVGKFRTFNNNVDEFNSELRFLYNIVERNNSSANIFAHHKDTTQQFERDILNALDRYNKFMNDLKPYPQWKKKVQQQVGNWFHQIYNNIEQSETKRQIFMKMDRHEYFK